MWHVLPLEVQGLHLTLHETHKVLPVWERGLQQGSIREQDSDTILVFTHHPVHHVRLEHLAQPLCAQRPVNRLELLLVDLLQERALGVKDELLERGDHDCSISLAEAPLQLVPRLQHGLHVSGHALTQDVRVAPAGRICWPRRFKPADVKRRLAVEVAMHEVSKRAALHPITRDLRQRLPHVRNLLLDFREVLLTDVAPTTEGLRHGLAELALQAGSVEVGGAECPLAAKARGPGCIGQEHEHDGEHGESTGNVGAGTERHNSQCRADLRRRER
mmetsp:Transcript_106367/g.266509  ORF Transcript_106367/g.266509 Transcript_106367/m.266509 type:complete len:274 (+) Transcript_106367:279-1100(+)